MVKLGVSLTGIGQQPQGVDMQQSFREIWSTCGPRETWGSTSFIRDSTT